MNEQNPKTSAIDLHNLAEVEDAKLRQKTGKSYSQGQMVWRRFRSHKGAMISLFILFSVIVLSLSSIGAFGIPGWWGKSYTGTGLVVGDGSPSADFPFGQTTTGTDYFAQVMRGTQQSLLIAFVVGILSTFIGAIIGAISGYFRGRVDAVLMRMTDIVIVIPLLALAAVLGKFVTILKDGGVLPLAIVLGALGWTGLARLVRGEVLSLREKEFVAAAVAMGAKPSRVIFKHLLPNTIGVIVVNATFAISAAILLETALSYLGFGVQKPDVSLGSLISEYQEAGTTRPWLFWFPGIMILIIALCVNFIGDGLRDAFDPRQSGKIKRRALLGISGRKEALDASLKSKEPAGASSLETKEAETKEDKK
ncbi:MAG: ABC transporter permease [Microbacteriaceae bacterium]|nr:ABC transporter permease [Microbacteriaceae bacterium]